MRHYFPVLLLASALMLTALFSCNDPSALGSDLLAGDQVDVDFTDTLSLEAYIEKLDSVAVFFPTATGLVYENFLTGDYIDPIFGRVTSSVYSQIARNTAPPTFTAEGVTIDSVVLLLPYSEKRSYGKLDGMQTIEVFEIAEDLVDSTVAYSNQAYDVSASPIGMVTFVPKITDSVLVHVPGTVDSTIKTPPHLRIRLNDEFKNRIAAADSSNFLTSVEVRKFFKGFHLKPVFQNGNGGMVSFFLRDNNRFAGMKVYYHESDSTYGEYLFPIATGSVVTSHFAHDYSGAVVADFFPINGVSNDSLLFLQGMNGINMVLEIPYILDLKNIVVNKAELEFSILDLASDDPAYKPVDRILVYEITSDSTQSIIEDYTATINLTSFDQVYGGFPTADNKYRVNISAFMQDMIRGLATNKMAITVIGRPERASRVVLAGPGYHDISLRPRLKLSFSRY